MSSNEVVDIDIRSRITGSNDICGLEIPQFVKAGAGAGKTTSISGRVKNLLTKLNKDPEKMVIITYTTKAANELLTRIREVLEQEGYDNIDRLYGAKISTFHAFCYDLLKEYPIEFCVDPSSELLDERATNVMLESTFEKMIISAQDDNSEFSDEISVLLNFVEKSSNSEKKNLLKVLLDFYQNRDLKPVSIDTSELRDITNIEEEIKDCIITYYNFAKDLYNSIKSDKKDDKLYLHIKDKLIDKLNSLTEGSFVDFICNGNEELLSKQMGSQSNYNKPELLKKIKNEVNSPLSKLIRYRDNLNKILSYNCALNIFKYFKYNIESYKKLYGVIDFFDCLYLVHERLSDNKHLESLVQDRFDVVIVDEFQDSDPLQKGIAFSLAGDNKGKLFFVGDPKQSIYGFSRADISVYMETMNDIEKQSNGEVLELVTNFRSTGGIIDFINTNFSKILSDLEYKNMLPNCQNKDKDFSTEKWNLNLTLSGERSPKVSITRPREAFIVASEVNKLINSGKYEPGDFLILFKTSTSMEEYEKALKRLEIPVINTKSKNFLKDFVVLDMLNLLSLCAFPKDKFYKFAVEQSSLFNIDEEKLDLVLQKDINFIFKFEELFNISGLIHLSLNNNKKDYISLKENLISLVKSELESNHYNLKMTFSRLHDKAINDKWNPDDDLSDESLYIESIKSDSVKLMTIHASKGLESKVVILVVHDAGSMQVNHFIDRETKEIVLNSAFNNKTISKTLGLDDLTAKFEQAEKLRDQEDKRVMYVALTRAIERIVIVKRSDAKYKSFLKILLDQHPVFKEERSLSFTDYLEDFSSMSEYMSIYNIDENIETINVKNLNTHIKSSKSVTSIIEDRDIFHNENGRQNGKEFGSFVHKVMENICNILFYRKSKNVDCKLIINKLYEQSEHKLSSDNLNDIEVMLNKFLETQLAEEIMNADNIQTEIMFYAERNYHGIIDLIIESGNSIKIVDFKSDIPGDYFQEIKKHYEKQIDYYSRAMSERYQDRDIKQECVYLFV